MKTPSLRVLLLPIAVLLTQYAFAQQPVPLTSGIDRSTADPAVRIQDDAFRAVEGKWLANTPIPPDRNFVGVDSVLYDTMELQLKGLIEAAAADPGTTDPDKKKIGDLYASFMDEAHVESLGVQPLATDFARIDAMKTPSDLTRMIAEAGRVGVPAPFSGEVHQDAKDSSKYILDLGQGGLGLPDRDFYLVKTDKHFAEVRAAYVAYLTKILMLSGERDAARNAKAVFALETEIARVSWTRVERRDPVKAYNVVTVAKLPMLAPHLDWPGFLEAAGVAGKLDSVVVGQPTYIKRLDRLVATTPMSTWRAYFRTRYLQEYAPFLAHDFVATQFAFFGTALKGTPQIRDRWKRGVALMEPTIGEGLGKLYVAKYFPPQSKARIDQLVKNILAAYKISIDGLDWMGPDTKREAQAKLATFVPKIGYPAKWRDYSALSIDRADLVGNVERANAFEYQRNIDKLGQPIDRDEWGMTPQTNNAYYNPEQNEIVFPAGILRAPYFDPTADDAMNYGSIGATIGHEISHGFDDQGSQYDGQGNLRDWWTAEDRARFSEKTKALIAQFDAYSPVPGYHINGALTLGENIADNSGLAIAYKAYRISLGGKEAPVIDGLTGDQRFFMGYAQSWQTKTRDATVIAQVKSDPHATAEFRTNGALVNQPAFDAAFDVKPGDRMYLPPDKRVIIW